MVQSFWKWFVFIIVWFAGAVSRLGMVTGLHLRRLVAFDLQRVRVTEGEAATLIVSGVTSTSAQQFLVWRRSLLLFGVLLSLCNAVWQTHTSLDFIQQMGETWSTLGMIVEIVRLLTLFGLSLSALVALLWWKRPRASTRVLWCGLGAAFVIPLLLTTIPFHFAIDWDHLSQKTLEEMHKFLNNQEHDDTEPPEKPASRQMIVPKLQWLVDLLGAILSLVLALPSICTIFPSVLRACLRVKTLLPEAITPGWFLLSVLPLYFLLMLIVFVISSLVFREPVLLASLGMFISAPLLHLFEIRRLMRPWNSRSPLRLTRFIAWTAMALNIGAVVLMVRYLSKLEFHLDGQLLRLLGWNPETSIMQYRDMLFWLTDFLGRSVILTVAVSDLLVAATVALGRQGRKMGGEGME